MPASTNEFWEPESYDHVIGVKNGGKLGTLRVKPSSILWKPAGAQKFYSKSLDDFIVWMRTGTLVKK